MQKKLARNSRQSSLFMTKAVSIVYSKKLSKIMSKKDLATSITKVAKATGSYMLGRHAESSEQNAILYKSFASWRSKDNDHTRKFSKYKPKYAKLKSRRSQGNFLYASGNLFKDVIVNARLRTSGSMITISASKGKSSAYQAVHQFGSGNTPARPFYNATQQDHRTLSSFVQKRLLEHFRGLALKLN